MRVDRVLPIDQPLQKDKLNDQVLDRLCTLLRQGEFTPGEAATVASISEAFQISAMPGREAITRLIAVGALTRVSGRSVRVPLLSRAYDHLIEALFRQELAS